MPGKPATVVEATLDRPRDLADALARLAADPDLRPLGGGSAVVPEIAATDGVVGPTARRWLAVDRIPELTAPVAMIDGSLTFGGATRLTDLETHQVIRAHVPILATAVASVAGPALRNRATIGGSLALGPASPDPATALAALDARIVVARMDDTREVPIGEVRPRDLIVGVRIPPPDPVGWVYRRFMVRGTADRPIVTVAVVLVGLDVRIALGAACPTVRRLGATEAAVGNGEDPVAAASRELGSLPVVADDRATAAYRRRIAAVVIGRAVAEARTGVARRGR